MLSCFADFRQILSMYKLKFSLSSIVMPSMSTDGTAWICSKPITNLTSVLFDLHLSSTMAWNLSGFANSYVDYVGTSVNTLLIINILFGSNNILI